MGHTSVSAPGLLEFDIPGALLAALLAGVPLPLYLLLVTRLPGLAGRNPIQFLLGSVIAFGVWLLAVLVVPAFRPSGIADLAVALMALAGGMLVYLEIWGLLSRGYTLAVLLTLAQAGKPLAPEEISAGYRGGDGLEWIMRHRVAGMIAAGVVERRDTQLVLTPGRGMLVARLYRLSIAVLGLRRTG